MIQLSEAIGWVMIYWIECLIMYFSGYRVLSFDEFMMLNGWTKIGRWTWRKNANN